MRVIATPETDRELKRMREEAFRASQMTEVQNVHTRIDYDRLDWLSYGEECREEGEIIGAVKIMRKQGQSALEIINQLMAVFGLSRDGAEKSISMPA